MPPPPFPKSQNIIHIMTKILVLIVLFGNFFLLFYLANFFYYMSLCQWMSHISKHFRASITVFMTACSFRCLLNSFSEFHPLTDADAQRIIHNWIFLKENLVQHEIRDFFINENFWDQGDIEEIDAEKTPKERNEKFLKLLLQSGQRAYEVFVAALQEKCSTHIIDKLQNTRTTTDSTKPAGKNNYPHVLGGGYSIFH